MELQTYVSLIYRWYTVQMATKCGSLRSNWWTDYISCLSISHLSICMMPSHDSRPKGQWTALLFRTPQVPVSNINPNTYRPIWSILGFPQCFHTSSGIAPRPPLSTTFSHSFFNNHLNIDTVRIGRTTKCVVEQTTKIKIDQLGHILYFCVLQGCSVNHVCILLFSSQSK